MKNIRFFLSENFQFFGGKIFSVSLKRHVFVMQASDILSIVACGEINRDVSPSSVTTITA